MKSINLKILYFFTILFNVTFWLFSSGIENTIISLVILLFLLTIFPYLLENKITLYNPIFIISAYFFITYGLSSLLTLIYPELGQFKIGLDGIVESLNFSILAFILFTAGFYSTGISPLSDIKRKIIKILPTMNKYDLELGKLLSLSIILLILGWSARIYWFTSGAYYHSLNTSQIVVITVNPLIRQFVVIMITFPLILALIYIHMYISRKERKYFITAMVILLFEFVYWLPSGSKEQLFIPLFFSLIIISFKNRIPIRAIVAVISTTIFMIFPFMNLYRMQKVGNIDYTFYLLIEMYKSFNLSTLEEILKFIFGVRLNYSLILSVVITKAENVWGFLGGATYTDFFVQLIPRFIWFDKPSIEIGQSFGKDFGLISPTDYNTSVGMTWLGEMFLNFGWFGIIVAFFMGIFFRFFYDYFFSKKIPNLFFSIFYIIIFYNLIRLDGTFVAQLSGVIKTCLIYILIFLPFVKVCQVKV